MESLSSQIGKEEYLESPYVTAGDRLYMVGHQDGSFPDLGWHVEGEMGGIWDHPIKLMDGFAISVKEPEDDSTRCLDNAIQFINYPVGNRHIFQNSEELRVERTQFVPDGIEGVVVELFLENLSERDKSFEISFTGMVDLMPVWLSDSLQIENGSDIVQWNEEHQIFSASDKKNSWFAVFGSGGKVKDRFVGDTPCSTGRKGKGQDATITSSLELAAGSAKTVQFYIAGSFESKENAISSYKKISLQPAELLSAKIERYERMKAFSDLSIPNREISEMYTWLKYNTDWLIRDVEGKGRGISAGIPDYPWWFAADNAYTLQGLLATGRFDEVYSTINLLYRLSEKANGNGRMIHEASTNGVVYNRGNMNETPHMIWLLWKTYEWTGDKTVLSRYYNQMQKGIEFLLHKRDPDGNLYPNGHGMMEIRGLDTEMIDVAVYTQQALQAAAKIAEQLDKSGDRKKYQDLADELIQKINSEWWVEDFSSFADFRATQSQTLTLIDDAIVRADTLEKPWAVKELQNARKKILADEDEGIDGYVLHHNWVVNTPMEMGIADSSKARKALTTARNYASRFGMYVTGIDRNEAREESNKWEIFSYVGAVMTLPTGVQAIAEANYGNIENSYQYMNMLSNSFSYALPGSMYEVSPDYGMMVQAWNIYSVAVPIIEYYFGIKPRAYEKKVIICPRMPEGWDNVSLDNVRVGKNMISISKKTIESSVTYNIQQELPGWEVELQLAPPIANLIDVRVNGKPVEADIVDDQFQIKLTGKLNEVTTKFESNPE